MERLLLICLGGAIGTVLRYVVSLLAVQWLGAEFRYGTLVVNVVEMPIKCPVAPLEFAFLADAYFTRRGIRDKVKLVYATPLDGAFTKPTCSRSLALRPAPCNSPSGPTVSSEQRRKHRGQRS